MADELPETSELVAFVAVVDAGSVSGAADELGLPRATVSRRLARLEERLGVRLLRRTTRRSALTDAGTELYGHARAALAAVGEGWGALRRADGVPRGLLRVSVPPAGGEISQILLDFVRAFPEVRLEVEVATRHVDLIGEGFDVAVRATGHLDPGLVARELARFRTHAFASREYLERHGTPATPDDLRDHACLLGFERGERPVTWWPLLDGGRVRVDGRLVCNDLGVLLEAVTQGLGIALLPDRSGEDLSPVLQGVVGSDVRLALVYPEREFLPPAVRAFVDHVVAASGRMWDRQPGR